MLRQLSGFESRHISKIPNGQMDGKHTLARQKIYKKSLPVSCLAVSATFTQRKNLPQEHIFPENFFSSDFQKMLDFEWNQQDLKRLLFVLQGKMTIYEKPVKRRGWHFRSAYPWKTMFSLTLSSRNGLAMLYRILKILKSLKGIIKVKVCFI